MWLYVNLMHAVFVWLCTRKNVQQQGVWTTVCTLLLLFTPHDDADGQQMMKKLRT
jgi:hypothetical protein